jgi:polysaccharide export outer membrane protein
VKVETESAEKFLLVEVNRAVAQKMAQTKPKSLTTNFLPNTAPGPIVIGAGDVLDIAIVSTNANGFIDFTQSSVSPVSSTSLPPQTVGTDGAVSVPPLGRVNARGQSVQQFEQFLTRKLGEILVDPSVIVNLAERNSAQVSVVGDVNSPGRYPITQDSKHIIDIISAAGGPITRPEDLTVTVNRGGSTASIAADRLLANPHFNVHLQPNDVVTVKAERKTYSILGAATRNRAVEFTTNELTLAEALGEGSGLQNRRADKHGVFLYREVAKSVAGSVGGDTSQFAEATVPTIFQFDMAEPTTLFHAGKFTIQDGDIIYISDNIAEEINGALSAFTAFIPAPVEYVRAETIN